MESGRIPLSSVLANGCRSRTRVGMTENLLLIGPEGLDYDAAAAKYVEAFMQNVKWEKVNHRYVAAQKISASPKN